VSTQQENHATAVPLGLRYGPDDLAEITRGEDVGKAGEKGGEGVVGAGREREQMLVNLVSPLGDWDRRKAGEVCLTI